MTLTCEPQEALARCVSKRVLVPATNERTSPTRPTVVVVSSEPPAPLDMLRTVVGASGARRRHLLDEFIAAQRKPFRQVAYRLCRALGVSAPLHQDDVEQVIALEMLAWIDELVSDPSAIEGIGNFEGMLHVRCRAAVRAWADRHLSPASGMVSLNRRIRRLNRLREELRSTMGMEPSDLEVQREHNRRAALARKDALRQGMMASPADFSAARPSVDVQALDLALSVADDGLLHATEGPRFVQAVVQRARAIGGVTAQVAEVWLGGVYDSEGDQRVLTSREVAEHLVLSVDSASAQIRKVRALARRVLAEDFGITGG